MKVRLDHNPNYWGNKTCSKPPISNGVMFTNLANELGHHLARCSHCRWFFIILPSGNQLHGWRQRPPWRLFNVFTLETSMKPGGLPTAMFDYQKPYSSYIVPIISTENPEWTRDLHIFGTIERVLNIFLPAPEYSGDGVLPIVVKPPKTLMNQWVNHP